MTREKRNGFEKIQYTQTKSEIELTPLSPATKNNYSTISKNPSLTFLIKYKWLILHLGTKKKDRLNIFRTAE